MAAEDDRIRALSPRLRELQASLGDAYWQDPHVIDLQDPLRRTIGRYAAWSEDKGPMHQRARQAARFESELAFLLWPGRRQG